MDRYYNYNGDVQSRHTLYDDVLSRRNYIPPIYNDDVQSRQYISNIYDDVQSRQYISNIYDDVQSKADQYRSASADIYGDVQSRQTIQNTHNGGVHSRQTIPNTYNGDVNSRRDYTSYSQMQSKADQYRSAVADIYGDAQSRHDDNPYAKMQTKADQYRSAIADIYGDAQSRQNIPNAYNGDVSSRQHHHDQYGYNLQQKSAYKRNYEQISPHLAEFFSNTVFAYAAQATVEAAVHASLPLNRVPLNVNSGDLSAFTKRLLSLAIVPGQSILLALRYLSLYFANKDNLLTPQDLRHLLAGSLILANKYIDDSTYKNSIWAQAIGISLKELNRVERDILSALGYSLSCSEIEYENWLDSVSSYVFARTESVGVSTMADKAALSQIVHDRAGLGKAEERRDLERRFSLQHRQEYEELEALAMAMFQQDGEVSMAGPIPEEYLPTYERVSVTPEFHLAEEYLPVHDRAPATPEFPIAQEYLSMYDRVSAVDEPIPQKYLPAYDRVEDLNGPIPEKYLPVYNRVEPRETGRQETRDMHPASRSSAWITSYLGQWLLDHSMHQMTTLVGGR